MSTIELLKPVLNNGIETTNFFNGRLLSAEDLKRQEDAHARRFRDLGAAMGEGIACGLEVSATPGVDQVAYPTVSVKAGLTCNRLGQTLRLESDIDVTLSSTAAEAAIGRATVFKNCVPPTAQPFAQVNGVYLLTIFPAQSGEGLAPVSWLGDGVAPCNTDLTRETVRFRLVEIDLTDVDAPADPKLLRNYLAYACFGYTTTSNLIADPFGAAAQSYGLLDSLRPDTLMDCEVPLALIHWTTYNGIEFVDNWSVRRRITAPMNPGGPGYLLSDRRRSEAEAMLMQFQEQIRDIALLLNEKEKSIAEANTWFRWLPPAGFIPWAGKESFGGGFSEKNFFKPLARREPVFVNGARVGHIIDEAMRFAPINLNDTELIWFYRLRENQQAVETAKSNKPQSSLLFTSGHMQWYGEARFDTARWNYANYSLYHV